MSVYKYQPMHHWDGEWDRDGPAFLTVGEAINWIKSQKDAVHWEIRVISDEGVCIKTGRGEGCIMKEEKTVEK